MTIEEPETNHCSDHMFYWPDDPVQFMSSIFDDPNVSADVNTSPWWDQADEIYPINTNNTSVTNYNHNITSNQIIPQHASSATPTVSSDSSKKRKSNENPITKSASDNNQDQRKNYNRKQVNNINEDQEVSEQEQVAVSTKKPNVIRKGSNKLGSNNGNNGNNREGCWAEQLLNPCALAIASSNLTRVQHLLYVLYELASPTGDANHRLASHGLRALTQYLSSTNNANMASPFTFVTTEAKFFQRSLFKFNEVSPWFAFPNNIANSSIVQVLANQDPEHARILHIVDIGVSHGMQWPTLLEALTRRSGGPPPLIRITVVMASHTQNDRNPETPFSIGPPGDTFSSRLLSFAKSMSINLQINILDDHPLQCLMPQAIDTNTEETLIVCAQFRLHHLNHNSPDERTEFLRVLRSLNPKGVILSENNKDCSCNCCGDFALRFSRRVEHLWKFLDSTSSAFKGRESEERRLMEGEAAKVLTSRGEMNETKEKWYERMRRAGFVGEVFSEDVTDSAKALLRKYDSNWEMRTEEKDGCVGLWWKGQPVSFCSLWKLDDE